MSNISAATPQITPHQDYKMLIDPKFLIDLNAALPDEGSDKDSNEGAPDRFRPLSVERYLSASKWSADLRRALLNRVVEVAEEILPVQGKDELEIDFRIRFDRWTKAASYVRGVVIELHIAALTWNPAIKIEALRDIDVHSLEISDLDTPEARQALVMAYHHIYHGLIGDDRFIISVSEGFDLVRDGADVSLPLEEFLQAGFAQHMIAFASSVEQLYPHGRNGSPETERVQSVIRFVMRRLKDKRTS